MAKSTRNEFEFMSMVLDALGVEYEEADIKQRERWRGKVLDGWGVEYVTDDLKQFARWRKKCLEGLAKNSGGGGGGSSDCPMKIANITVNVGGGEGGRAFVHFSGVDNIDAEMVSADFINTPVHGLAYDLTDSQWVVYGTDMANGALSSGDSTVITALIFEGESIRISGGEGVSAVTGEATVNEGVAVVTGDCTVTLLGVGM